MKKPTTLILLFLTLSIQAQYTCETAQSASAGSNTLPATDSSEYWYSYTMAGDNMLIIETDLGPGPALRLVEALYQARPHSRNNFV